MDNRNLSRVPQMGLIHQTVIRIFINGTPIKEVVLICFDWNKQNACFTYDDDEVTEFVFANEYHFWARLGHYKNQIITVGCTRNSQSHG